MADKNGGDPGRVPWLVDKLVNVGLNLILTASFSVAATLTAVQTGLVDLGKEVLPQMQSEIENRLGEIDAAVARVVKQPDLEAIRDVSSRTEASMSELRRDLRQVESRLDANVDRVDGLRERLEDRVSDIRSHLDTRTARVQRVVESRLDRLSDEQEDHRDSIMVALGDIADARQANQHAMERLFDSLVASDRMATLTRFWRGWTRHCTS